MVDTIKKIEEGDLVALFSICTNEELEPIVQILIDQKMSAIKKQANFKKFYPDHSKYYKSIVEAIQLFGGNSLANFTRKGAGVSYNEIVFNVCERLGVPRTKNEIVSNEVTLLRLYELEAESINKNKFNIKSDTLITLFPIIGAVNLLSMTTGPAYRVTVPCVTEIAQLRQKKINEYNFKNKKNEIVPVFSEQDETKNNIVTIENEGGEVALSLMQLPDSFSTQSWSVIKDKDCSVSHLNPLLQAVPALATNFAVNSTNYMEVVINGPLTQAKSFLQDGAYRAITKGANGKITENAKLFNSSNLSNVVNPAALFQIASVAVAQKHLADINQRLSEIKRSLENIEDFLQEGRRAKILSSIAYFEEKAEPILVGGEYSDAVLNQIEASEREMLAVQLHLFSDIHRFNKELDIKNSAMFGTDKLIEEIKAEQLKVKDLYLQLLLCIRARACGWQLLSLFPGNGSLVNKRKSTLKSELVKLAKDGLLLKETELSLVKQIKSISSTFNSDTTLNERKLVLLDLNLLILSEVTAEKNKIELEVEDADLLASSLKAPVSNLLVKIENQKIVATNVMGF